MKNVMATDRLMTIQVGSCTTLQPTELAGRNECREAVPTAHFWMQKAAAKHVTETAATKAIARAGSSERGVALFVALIMLVIISILGIAALRSSVTNARITTGIQAGTLSFQAAQSAINAAANEMIGSTAGQVGNVLTDMITARSAGNVAIQYRCVTGANSEVAITGASATTDMPCSSSQTVDSRGLVQAGSRSFLQRNMLPAPGWALSGPGAYGYNQIVIVGSGAVPSIGISNLNVQQLALLGPKPQGSLD